jgi:hypothetical protein
MLLLVMYTTFVVLEVLVSLQSIEEVVDQYNKE